MAVSFYFWNAILKYKKDIKHEEIYIIVYVDNNDIVNVDLEHIDNYTRAKLDRKKNFIIWTYCIF